MLSGTTIYSIYDAVADPEIKGGDYVIPAGDNTEAPEG